MYKNIVYLIMVKRDNTNTETPKMNGITQAVNDQLRQAQARHSNFEMGLPAPGDNTAVDYFERIRTQLEYESARVRVAQREAVLAVRRGREALAIGRDSELS